MRQRGFTLAELGAVLALLLLLAAIVTPIAHHEVSRSTRGAALAEAHRLAVAISDRLSDTLAPPGDPAGSRWDFLYSHGIIPDGNPYPATAGGAIEAGVDGDRTLPGWRGPYLEPDSIADPWGSAYLIFVRGFADPTQHVWVLSAGPDRQLQTQPSDATPAADDVGIMIQ